MASILAKIDQYVYTRMIIYLEYARVNSLMKLYSVFNTMESSFSISLMGFLFFQNQLI